MSVILTNRYRELDQREQDLKLQLETVRAQKREIMQKIFVPAPAEALPIEEANSRVPDGDVRETREDHQNRSESPVREPLILQSTLP